MKVFSFSHKELKFVKNEGITPFITIENYDLQINEDITFFIIFENCKLQKTRILNLPLSLKIMVCGTMKLSCLPLRLMIVVYKKMKVLYFLPSSTIQFAKVRVLHSHCHRELWLSKEHEYYYVKPKQSNVQDDKGLEST
jgi:hypothetical protein